MPEMPEPTSIEVLAERFAVFLVDQFGVLLDGKMPYPGAAGALRYLKDQGSTVIILSNSGRAGQYNADRLAKLGIAPELYDRMVTSGDVAFELVANGAVGFPSAPGTRCLTISSGNDTNLSQRLDFVEVTSATEAEVVVISGSRGTELSVYAELLRPAAARQVPAICTNPDIHMLTGSGIAPGAGAIARLYEELGGVVRWFGKPYADIYQHAMRIADNPPKSSIIAIGDSIDHDILGAAGAGIDSALVRTGIHSGLTDDQLSETLKETGISPGYILPAFRLD